MKINPVEFEIKPLSTPGREIGVIRLNVPAKLNALDLTMVKLIRQQLIKWQACNRVVAVWLESSMDKAFCAGGDVQALYHSAIESPGGPCDYAEAFFEEEYRLNHLMHTFGKPIIVWASGIVMGGGMGLMQASSHRIVTENSRLAMPEITIALYPDVAGCHFLNNCPAGTGLFTALTAASLNANDALFMKLADYSVPYDVKSDLLQRIQATAFDGNETDHKKVSNLISDYTANELDALEDFRPSNIEKYASLIDQLITDQPIEMVISNLLNIEINDPWFNKCQKALHKGSPISLMNTFTAMQRVACLQNKPFETRSLYYAELFQLELTLSTNIVRHPEFSEGVRALLIDKDNQPNWIFNSVDAVPMPLIDSMFEPPWDAHPLRDLG